MRLRGLTAVLVLATGLVLSGATTSVWAVDSDGDGVDDFYDVCDNTPPGTAVDDEGRPLGDIDRDCDNDLEDYALSQQGFTGPLAPPVVIDTVSVGNPGNPNDTHGDGYGAVDYSYNISKYEVTAGQYAEFLNAVAATDAYGLYSTSMLSSSDGCKIRRTGSPGGYAYLVDADEDDVEDIDWVDRPVNYVSWGDAARFANWLHNGQPIGAQDLTTTEDGSYYLNGATSDVGLLAVVREPDATWVIPSEDEWYKAAYHYNDGMTGNYWDYPTSNDSVPSNDLVDPDPGNNATFYDGGYTIGSPYYRTEVSAHESSNSPYGTFDQGGNVWEWNEAVVDDSFRGWRGGSFYNNDLALPASFRASATSTTQVGRTGFRVAELP